jgi:hypothetical protein
MCFASFDGDLDFKLQAKLFPTAFQPPTLGVNGPDDGIEVLSNHYSPLFMTTHESWSKI